MPGLAQSLQGQDLGHLKMVAELWGIELQAGDANRAIDQISRALPPLVVDLEDLKPAARDALIQLASAGGRLPWSQFERRFGAVRVMGSARRDKERPHRNPVSVAEQLWYRALVGRAFFDSETGLEEFAYIPDELLADLPNNGKPLPVYGRPARPEERAYVQLGSDRILDDATDLLAALRINLDVTTAHQAWVVPVAGLTALLAAAGLLDSAGVPVTSAARKFLEAKRGVALLQLVSAWLSSKVFDELRLVPSLVAEGSWDSRPAQSRAKILDLVSGLPAGQWWSLPAFIADVKKYEPDFQRQAGDYDSWYLRAAESGEYLRGFEHWDAVDGALLAFFVRGPLAWLGLVDLGSRSEGEDATAFRLSDLAKQLLNGKAPNLPIEGAKLKVDSRGMVSAPRLTPRAVRYQISRFCDWLPAKQDNFQYQISAHSLAAARQQNLRVPQLLTLLKANASAPLPPNLIQALKRWEQQGSQGRLTPLLVLRVQSAAALKALRASRAARYLAEPIGPLAVAVKPGSAQQVLQALLELGYFGELEE